MEKKIPVKQKFEKLLELVINFLSWGREAPSGGWGEAYAKVHGKNMPVRLTEEQEN